MISRRCPNCPRSELELVVGSDSLLCPKCGDTWAPQSATYKFTHPQRATLLGVAAIGPGTVVYGGNRLHVKGGQWPSATLRALEEVGLFTSATDYVNRWRLTAAGYKTAVRLDPSIEQPETDPDPGPRDPKRIRRRAELAKAGGYGKRLTGGAWELQPAGLDRLVLIAQQEQALMAAACMMAAGRHAREADETDLGRGTIAHHYAAELIGLGLLIGLEDGRHGDELELTHLGWRYMAQHPNCPGGLYLVNVNNLHHEPTTTTPGEPVMTDTEPTTAPERPAGAWSGSSALSLDPATLVPNPANPRGPVVHDDALEELAASLDAEGMLEPVIVAPLDTELAIPAYVIIAGHRRVAAAVLRGWPEVPALVRPDLAEAGSALSAMIIENLHREDLSPLQEAQAFEQLRQLGLKQTEIADRVGVNQGTVSKRLALLKLPEEVAAKVDTGEISVADGVELSKVDPEQAAAVAAEATKPGGNVSRAAKEAADRAAYVKARDKIVAELEAKGVAVVDEQSFWNRSSDEIPLRWDGDANPRWARGHGNRYVDVDPGDAIAEHVAGPCGAVALHKGWDHDAGKHVVRLIPICLDPTQHGLPSTQELLAADDAEAEAAAAEEAAQEAARQQAAEAFDKAVSIVFTKADPTSRHELALTVLAEAASQDESPPLAGCWGWGSADRLAQLLGITAEGDEQRAVAIERMVADGRTADVGWASVWAGITDELVPSRRGAWCNAGPAGLELAATLLEQLTDWRRTDDVTERIHAARQTRAEYAAEVEGPQGTELGSLVTHTAPEDDQPAMTVGWYDDPEEGPRWVAQAEFDAIREIDPGHLVALPEADWPGDDVDAAGGDDDPVNGSAGEEFEPELDQDPDDPVAKLRRAAERERFVDEHRDDVTLDPATWAHVTDDELEQLARQAGPCPLEDAIGRELDRRRAELDSPPELDPDEQPMDGGEPDEDELDPDAPPMGELPGGRMVALEQRTCPASAASLTATADGAELDGPGERLANVASVACPACGLLTGTTSTGRVHPHNVPEGWTEANHPAPAAADGDAGEPNQEPNAGDEPAELTPEELEAQAAADEALAAKHVPTLTLAARSALAVLAAAHETTADDAVQTAVVHTSTSTAGSPTWTISSASATRLAKAKLAKVDRDKVVKLTPDGIALAEALSRLADGPLGE